MREILRMVLVLSIITSVSGYFLGSVKNATKNRIEEQVMTYVQGPALESLFSDYDNDPVADHKKIAIKDHEYTVFPFYKNKKLAGIAYESFAPGYSGNIGVMAGFRIEENDLAGICITTMTETPGLGSRIADPGFVDQFAGHALAGTALNGDGGDIDGVSGATYSSVGAVTAVQKALELYPLIWKKLAGEPTGREKIAGEQ